MKQHDQVGLTDPCLANSQVLADSGKQWTRATPTKNQRPTLYGAFQPFEGAKKQYARVVLTDLHITVLQREGFASIPIVAQHLANEAVRTTHDANEACRLAIAALHDVHIAPEIWQALYRETMRQIIKRNIRVIDMPRADTLPRTNELGFNVLSTSKTDTLQNTASLEFKSINVHETNIVQKVAKLDYQEVNVSEKLSLWPRLSTIEQALVDIQQTVQMLVMSQQQDHPERDQMLREANEDRLRVAHRSIQQM